MWLVRGVSRVPCILLGTFAIAANAQSVRVGHIDAVRGIVSNQSCRRAFALPGSRDSLAIIRRGTQASAWPLDSAFLLDRLRVRRSTDVRFHVDSGRFGNGTFYLAPELGQCAEAVTGLRVSGMALSGTGVGSYSLSSRQETLPGRQVDRLILSVENGGAVIEWASGSLSVYALGREIRDSGTVFAVVVDSASNRALLYVQSGAVAMAGAAGLQATSGRAFVFGRAGPPQPVTVSEAFVNDVVYQSRVVWTQDFPPTNSVSTARGHGRLWAVLGSTAVVGAVYLAKRDNPSAGKRKGTVVVRIPI